MSIYVMAPVLRCAVPAVAGDGTDAGRGSDGSTLKLVLLGLADSANEDGTGARVGVRDLAVFAQCHTGTVVRALRHLAELGAITVDDPGGPGRVATYTVVLDWVMAGVAERHARKVPRAPEARKGKCAPEAREARASEAREARAPEARTYVPTSHTSAISHRWPPCITPGCDVPVDPWSHRIRCPDHDTPPPTTTTDPIPPDATG